MIDFLALAAGWNGLVGFRPTMHPNAPQLPAPLVESRSGLYVTDVAPSLLATQTLLAALPADYQVPTVGTTGETYQPGTAGQVAAVLRYALHQAAAWVGTALVQDARYTGRARTVQAETTLYEGQGDNFILIPKAGRFCGLEIRPHPNPDLVVEVTRIGLQGTGGDFTGVPIYLYHQDRAEPLAVWNLVAPLNGWGRGFAWSKVPAGTFLLRAGGNDSEYAGGGAFVLGYYEDDLPVGGQVANRPKLVLDVGCSSCDAVNYARATTWAAYFQARAVQVPNAALEPETRAWLPSAQLYPTDTNNGLNLSLVARCELTPLLLRQEATLAPLVKLQTAVELLQLLATTTSNNTEALSARDSAVYRLHGDGNRRAGERGGLIQERDALVQALTLDVADGRPPCLVSTARLTVEGGAV